MAAKRTDIHRPEIFNPEDYEYVGAFDNSPEPGSYVPDFTATMPVMPVIPEDFTMPDGSKVPGTNWVNAQMRWLRGKVADSPTATYGDCFQCDHCGARIRYVAVFVHTPSGDHIAVGETCAEGRMTYSKADFDRLRKAAALDRKAQRLLTAWNAFKVDHADVDWDALYASENDFVQDVLRKGRQYGDLSERQLTAIQEAVVRDAERAAKALAEAENPTPKIPAPEGKATITGEVVSLKWKDSEWGGGMKMTVVVRSDEGEYAVWGSQPAALGLNAHWDDEGTYTEDRRAVEVGDMVTFTATFTRSDQDEAFAFFKRPTKASIVTLAEASA